MKSRRIIIYNMRYPAKYSYTSSFRGISPGQVQTVSEFSGTENDDYDDDKEEVGDGESMTSHVVHTNDLEKSNAVVAAFTVVGIFSLFFIEIGLTVVFMIIISNGDQLNQRIAHSKFTVRN